MLPADAFRAAFCKWDGRAAAAAVREIVEAVLAARLDVDDVDALTWAIRELLDRAPSALDTSSVVTVQHTTLQLAIEAVRTDDRVTALRVSFGVGPRAPESLRQRWQLTGMPKDGFVVAREELELPVVFRGEPGFGAQRMPSIHVAPGAGRMAAEATWAAGRGLASGSGPWLERYRAGDCRTVWRELFALGPDVRRADVFGDAVDVALETMQRVRRAVELLHARLADQGYHFTEPGDAIRPAPHNADQLIADLERHVGPIPLSLCAFYTAAGVIDLRGVHPGWTPPGQGVLDPLVVGRAKYVLGYDEDNWHRHRYSLAFAPDCYHKEDISGGPPYALLAPCAAVDDVVRDEATQPGFVALLRRSLQFGGFPGWSRVDQAQRPHELLAALTSGLPDI